MDEIQELMNVRVIRVTTEAAVLSAPAHTEAHRQRAARLLDDAEQRTSSDRVRAEIASMRAHLAEAATQAEDERADA